MEVIVTYKVYIQNRFHHDYPEDDWCGVGFGYTLNEAFKEAMADGLKRGDYYGFEPSKVSVVELRTLNHGGQLFDIREEENQKELPYKEQHKLFDDNDLYIKELRRVRDERKEKAWVMATREALQMKLEDEKKQYEELKNKFEPPTE
jgi:hypothetical protein